MQEFAAGWQGCTLNQKKGVLALEHPSITHTHVLPPASSVCSHAVMMTYLSPPLRKSAASVHFALWLWNPAVLGWSKAAAARCQVYKPTSVTRVKLWCFAKQKQGKVFNFGWYGPFNIHIIYIIYNYTYTYLHVRTLKKIMQICTILYVQSVCSSTYSEKFSCMASRSWLHAKAQAFLNRSHLQVEAKHHHLQQIGLARFHTTKTWAKLAAKPCQNCQLSQDTSAPLKERCSISWRTLSRQRSIFKRWNCNSETSTNLATQRIEITKSDSNNLEYWDRHS